MKKILTFENLINSLLCSFVFISSLYSPSDPDLGWHLKYGEYFFKTGEVLRTNTFSQLMQDYKWNNSSWLTDLITYFIFESYSFIGLSVLGALIVVITFYFWSKASELTIFEKSIIFPIILFFVSPVNLASFRGQQISLLFTGVMFYLLTKYSDKKGYVLVIPILFILWSNLHGQYILGLAIFLIWILIFSVKEFTLNFNYDYKKFINAHKLILISFFSSLFAVMVNPFGYGVYLEAIKHFGNPQIRNISEYLSFTDYSQEWWHLLFTGIVIVMGIALLGNNRKSFDKAPFYIPSIILFILSLWIKRYAWTFYYSLMFLLKPIANYFKPPKEIQEKYTALVISFFLLIVIIILKYPFSDIRSISWESYCESTVKCSSSAATKVITENLNDDKLLTIYDYGGWLIWNYPEIKPTIDGRMVLWIDEKNYSAFEYYHPIEQNLEDQDIDKTEYNAVLTSRRKPIFDRLVELTNEGKWRAVFADDYSAVFVRNKN